MTREEQLQRESEVYAWTADQFDIQLAFKKGAKWADEHPKEGMVSIEKVCEWITQYIYIPYEGRTTEEGPIASDYINYAMERIKREEEVTNAFRKAMEE